MSYSLSPRRKTTTVEASLTTGGSQGLLSSSSSHPSSLAAAGFYRQYLMYCYASLFHNGCHHILATTLVGKPSYRNVEKGVERRWGVIRDQRAYVLWLLAL